MLFIHYFAETKTPPVLLGGVHKKIKSTFFITKQNSSVSA